MIFIFLLQPMICLPSQESCAFVRGLFMFVLHLCDAGAKLHGSLGQDSRLAEAQLLRCQSQEEFLPDTSRKWQICLHPHGQKVQVAHHVLVQVGKSADATVMFVRYSEKWRWTEFHLWSSQHWLWIFHRTHCQQSVLRLRLSLWLKNTKNSSN